MFLPGPLNSWSEGWAMSTTSNVTATRSRQSEFANSDETASEHTPETKRNVFKALNKFSSLPLTKLFRQSRAFDEPWTAFRFSEEMSHNWGCFPRWEADLIQAEGWGQANTVADRLHASKSPTHLPAVSWLVAGESWSAIEHLVYQQRAGWRLLRMSNTQ